MRMRKQCVPSLSSGGEGPGVETRWNHIYTKPLDQPHPDKYDESTKESRSQCKLDSFVHAKKYSAECVEEITRRIADTVARDLWPITIVEGADFKHLLSYLEPRYRVSSHTHIATVCRRLYNTQKERFKKEITGCGYLALKN